MVTVRGHSSCNIGCMNCAFETCDREASKRGWCRTHYMQWRRTGETWVIGTNPHRGRKACAFPECPRPVMSHGHCGAHAKQRRMGIELRPIREPRPDDKDGYRWCSTCKQFKDEALFQHPKGGRVARTCDDCRAAQMREYNARPERKLAARWKRAEQKYGITQDQYRALWDAQEGLCAICRTALDDILASGEDQRYKSAIDHDHTTGAVRGLLCGPCNCAIGYMKDDPMRLEAAAVYLREHSLLGA